MANWETTQPGWETSSSTFTENNLPRNNSGSVQRLNGNNNTYTNNVNYIRQLLNKHYRVPQNNSIRRELPTNNETVALIDKLIADANSLGYSKLSRPDRLKFIQKFESNLEQNSGPVNSQQQEAQLNSQVAGVKKAKKPASKKPASKKPVAKKPASKKPASKKPVAKKPVAKKPVAKKPVAKKSASKK
jgi:hypothetical protein